MSDRILIQVVDDESKIRRLVSESLENNGFDTICASDGEQAIEVFMHANPYPDLVVMDIMMPGIDGFKCAEKIRAIENVPIIFLSARNESVYKLQAFEKGADDYVTKPFPVDELVARIRAVLRRAEGGQEQAKGIEEISNGPLCINQSKRLLTVNGRDVRLADTEFRLFIELMKRPGVVLPHDYLLRHVWGAEAVGEIQYLRVAFARIRRKLEEAGLEGGVISSYSRVGYILRDLKKDPL